MTGGWRDDYLEYSGVSEAEHREDILVDEQPEDEDGDEDGGGAQVHGWGSHWALGVAGAVIGHLVWLEQSLVTRYQP